MRFGDEAGGGLEAGWKGQSARRTERPAKRESSIAGTGQRKANLGWRLPGRVVSWHVAAEASINASATFKATGCTFAAGENCRASAMADGIRKPELYNPHKNEKDKLLV